MGKSIILISGAENTGKSNAIAKIYKSLWEIKKEHVFISYDDSDKHDSDEVNIFKRENIDYFPVKLPLEKDDVFAVFEIKGRKILVYSKGDVFNGEFNVEIKEFLKIYPDINIMILSERFNLNQRKREIYNYILNDFRKLGFELKLHLNTNPSFNDNTFNNQKNEIENIICDCVINYLETKTFKI